MLVPLGIIFAVYSPRVLLCLLYSNEQRMNLVPGDVAPCLSDVTSDDRCTTCTIALFHATLAITFLIMDYIVRLVGPEGLDRGSLYPKSCRR